MSRRERTTSLKLGSLIDGTAPWLEFTTQAAFRSFAYNDPQKNPKKLPVDVALVLGEVKQLTDGSTALANFTQLSSNLPTIVNP